MPLGAELGLGRQRLPCPQTVEFSLDSVTFLQHKGFTIEPPKGIVERGQTKTISISWVPPADFDVGASDRAWEPCRSQMLGTVLLRSAQGGAPGGGALAGEAGSAAARHRSGW